MLANQFAEKRKKIEEAKINLKTYFVGIDHIIDKVVDSISGWYLFPEAMTRPVIVNLWGMTGVGKTDLIRRLVKELDFSESYMEIQMSNKGEVSWEKTICEKLLNSDLEQKKPGILLLDEFQRFRTIEEDGGEIHDYNFQDVWMLLSDGKFGNDNKMKERISREIMSILWDRDEKENSVDSNDSTPDPSRKYKSSYWSAENLKSIFASEYTIEEIMLWDDDRKLNELYRIKNSKEAFKEIDYSKLLIFISGNLDEVFTQAVNVSDADRDPDDVYARTKNVNMIHIKSGLCERFKAEQIARLGNVHIIYPSISKDAFEGVIANRLASIQTSLSSVSKVNVVFDCSVNTSMFDNGVFPVQGVRPVLSTIDNFVNMYVSNVLIDAIEQGQSSVLISINGANVVATFDTFTKRYSYSGILDEIRKSRKKQYDRIANVAVHEAGHAVVYSVLFGLAPPQLIVNTTSDSSEGVTFMHPSGGSKKQLLDNVCVSFGGLVAEELVFGNTLASSGSIGDMKQATKVVASMLRQTGLYSEMGFGTYYWPAGTDNSYAFYSDAEQSNDMIQKIMRSVKDECVKILTLHYDLFKRVAKELNSKLYITPEDYAKICQQYGVPCGVMAGDNVVVDGYADIFNRFMESDSAVSSNAI